MEGDEETNKIEIIILFYILVSITTAHSARDDEGRGWRGKKGAQAKCLPNIDS